MKKDRSSSGGILLEVIFMLAIMLAVFPIMQANMKKRTDAIRNQMVVKDLLKLKTAVENYLKKKPTFKDELTDLDFEVLFENGLEKTFQQNNVLGQEYKVRVKVSNVDGNSVYDAIVIATGGDDIPVMRIRDIVKEAKGYAGYYDDESKLIYGPNWQISSEVWNTKSGDDSDFDSSSIVMKTGFSKKEYKYISRDPNVGEATMKTDMFMNMQNIVGVNNLYVYGFLQTGDLILQNGNFVDVTVANSPTDDGGAGDYSEAALLEIDNMSITNVLRFPLGIIMKNLSFTDNDFVYTYLKQYIKTKNISFDTDAFCVFENATKENSCNKLRFVDVVNLIPDGTMISIANLLKFNGDTSKVVSIGDLIVQSFDSDKVDDENGEEGPLNLGVIALKFSNVQVDNHNNFKIDSSQNTVGLSDIVVSEVNRKLIGVNGNGGGSIKIGGVDINEKTPLSVIFRALYYEYADIHKIVGNDYPDYKFLPWHLDTYLRCEYASNKTDTCGDGWYY